MGKFTKVLVVLGILVAGGIIFRKVAFASDLLTKVVGA